MDNSLAKVPQRDRIVGNRSFNTERKMSVPALPIDPPNSVKRNYFNLLVNNGNPFHRRGTEISRGYDTNKLRKNALSFMDMNKNLTPKYLKSIPSMSSLRKHSA